MDAYLLISRFLSPIINLKYAPYTLGTLPVMDEITCLKFVILFFSIFTKLGRGVPPTCALVQIFMYLPLHYTKLQNVKSTLWLHLYVHVYCVCTKVYLGNVDQSYMLHDKIEYIYLEFLVMFNNCFLTGDFIFIDRYTGA